eukprot:TRINITY_DN12595_c0_g1_i1.p1 TRINITY_DN12595_c0_g1~~TRINITY_DN12595_c0_g1_i1.p1  ORF type:complete len:107 (-),score=11.42 TRINITY_DN12595_c0_g1_i1:221-541(-)
MASQGVLKHVFLAKFKPDITPERVQELIKGYANLVNLIEPMKSFEWGEDVSVENLHQGFTHVFVSTFDNEEGRDAYLIHSSHVEYANQLIPVLEKYVIVDYKPSVV